MRSQLISTIRKVLFEQWDPAGINYNPNLTDEYDAYVEAVANLLDQKPSLWRIETLLSGFEEQIGASATPQQRQAAALALSQLIPKH